MVGLGILAGTYLAAANVKKKGLEPKHVWDLSIWIAIAAFVVGRLFHVFIYYPGFYFESPEKIVAIWDGGLSIIGGFVGALIVTVVYLKRKKLNILNYTDAMIFGLPLGLFIGRIGCFLIHDQPGKETDFFLGVQHLDGITRHDHGLYLSIAGLILFFIFLIVSKYKTKTGTYLVVFLLYYGVVRFLLDFLRATEGQIVDQRYVSLTPAQYASIIMVIFGVYIWRKKLR